MSIKIRKNTLRLRDKVTGEMRPVAIFGSGADKSLEEIKQIAEQKKKSTVSAINTAAEDAKTSIKEKTDEQVARIPEVTKLAENVTQLKDDLSDLAPAGAVVGQLFRVAAVSEDGKYTMEPVDMLDVQINGASIVQDRVAILPVASVRNYGGIIRLKYAQGFASDVDGFLQAYNENSYISNRYTGRPLELGHLDFAVKAAMCDGKGAAWTAEEQAAARERIGIHKVTQAEYDALTDTSGFYIIVEE